MNPVFFDIETEPLPLVEVQHLMPEFEAPGNFKDPEKIKLNIEAQKAKWYRDAALDPMTGRVLVIGLSEVSVVGNRVVKYLEGTESVILETFWGLYRNGEFESTPWVGFNIRQFDLPFIVRRSWHLGVTIPDSAYNGRYWSDRYVDLMDLFACGQKGQWVSLDRVAKFLKVGEKNGVGADFSKNYQIDREQALAYLANDLKLLRDAAEVMGIGRVFPQRRKEAA